MSNLRAEAIFCDDIRHEDNGKQMLIGVYSADLVPGSIPAAFPLALWVRIHGLTEGKHKFNLRISNPSEQSGLELEGSANVLDSSMPSVFAFSSFPVHIECTGSIVATMSVDGGDPIEVGRLRVSSPQGATST